MDDLPFNESETVLRCPKCHRTLYWQRTTYEGQCIRWLFCKKCEEQYTVDDMIAAGKMDWRKDIEDYVVYENYDLSPRTTWDYPDDEY